MSSNLPEAVPTGVIFVEDPGAANCIVPLLRHLGSAGEIVHLAAAGHAVSYLAGRGVSADSSSVDSLERLLEKRPGWLLVGTCENEDSSAFILIESARRYGVPSFAIIDSAANHASRFRGRSADPLCHAPDWLLVPDEWTASRYIELGFPAPRVLVVGHPHYDHVQAVRQQHQAVGREALRRQALPAAALSRPVIVFASEISTGLDASQFAHSDEYTLHGSGASGERTHIVVDEFLMAVRELSLACVQSPYLILRLHPKEAEADPAPYYASFDMVSKGAGVLELLSAADLVVGMSSMLLLEAHVLGRPVCSILPREVEKDWLPALRSGDIPCATHRDQIAGLLANALASEPSLSTSAIDQPNSSAQVAAVLCARARR